MVAVVATLLLAAFQVALQAKPAHAWEVRISISGGGQVRETTSANLVGSNCFSPSTTPTGTVGKTCLAGTPSSGYGSAWDVDYVAEPASGFTFARWESDGSTRNAVICDRSTPPATTSTYTGATCKFRTFENLQTRAVFVDTQAPSQPSISSNTPQVTNQPASFSFSTFADPTFKGFECKVTPTVQPSFQPCSSPSTFSPTVDGTYTVEVQAVDWSGNRSFSVSRSWTRDTAAPNTTLVSNVGPAPGSTTQDNDPVFQFSSNESGSTFECNLTGPGLTNLAFSACNPSANSQTTKSYTNLKDGTYTFKVRARDQAGNVDTTNEDTTRTWTINNTPTVLSNSLTPANAATGVTRITAVGATFSEEMAAVSLKRPDNTSSTFKLQQYNRKTKKWKVIPATIALSNNNQTATLDPFGATEGAVEKPLAGRQKFKATITTGAMDADGNRIAKNVVWTFITGSS